MKKYFITMLLVLCCLPRTIPAQDMDEVRLQELTKAMEALRPLHQKPDPPGPDDWLAVHDEPGQTFLEYIGSNPVVPIPQRHVIYIQPIGEFTPTQYRIITLSAEFLGDCFNLPVKIKDGIPLSVIPVSARRKHPSWGVEQILTTYVLGEVLMPRLPEDAAVYLAFTASDLWPGPGWNFLFGQASTKDRVGVWSIYRNGDPDKSKADFQLCLLRTMKTAAHETGHMFSIDHCIKYKCLMRGSNHRAEADRRPLALCPECAAKVCWACNINIIERYEKLADFCRRNGFLSEAEFYAASIGALKNN